MINHNIKRIVFVFIFLISEFVGQAQNSEKVIISGIILNTDSLPLPDVAVINTRSGKTVRTNANGFFETTIIGADSLLAYHIACERLFINMKDNGKVLIMHPQIQELGQVDIIDHSNLTDEQRKALSNEITRLALEKKLEGYDKRSAQDYFYDENGSHNKAFSPYFGPTVRVSAGVVAEVISRIEKKRRLEKQTAHYRLIKKKNAE
jgi:hypothetical protein